MRRDSYVSSPSSFPLCESLFSCCSICLICCMRFVKAYVLSNVLQTLCGSLFPLLHPYSRNPVTFQVSPPSSPTVLYTQPTSLTYPHPISLPSVTHQATPFPSVSPLPRAPS